MKIFENLPTKTLMLVTLTSISGDLVDVVTWAMAEGMGGLVDVVTRAMAEGMGGLVVFVGI